MKTRNLIAMATLVATVALALPAAAKEKSALVVPGGCLAHAERQRRIT